MTTKVTIIKGRYKGQQGHIIGVYVMSKQVDVKIGRKYVTIPSSYTRYND